MHDFSNLIRTTLVEGMAVHLEYSRYLNEYKSHPIPKKMQPDSHYGVCFRVCLSRVLQIIKERGNKDIVHIVLERGHQNAGDCERIFNDSRSLATIA